MGGRFYRMVVGITLIVLFYLNEEIIDTNLL